MKNKYTKRLKKGLEKFNKLERGRKRYCIFCLGDKHEFNLIDGNKPEMKYKVIPFFRPYVQTIALPLPDGTYRRFARRDVVYQNIWGDWTAVETMRRR